MLHIQTAQFFRHGNMLEPTTECDIAPYNVLRCAKAPSSFELGVGGGGWDWRFEASCKKRKI